MNKKLISALVAGLALSAAAIAPAQGAPMSFVAGAVTFNFVDMFDQGTLYSNSCGATGQAACLGGSTFGDDSWGIFSVASIKSNVTGDLLWQSGVTTTSGVGTYLTGMFYGLTDSVVSYANGDFTAYSTGGKVDLYWNATTYNTTTVAASSRGALDQFAGITGGTKAATLNFEETADVNVPNSTYRSIYKTSSDGSNGFGYLDVVAGSGAASSADANANTTDLSQLMLYADQWTTPVTDPFGNVHDVKMTTGFYLAEGTEGQRGWTVTGGGTARTAIPEPASMALVGLGLMGLAGMRRRKQHA